MVENADNCVHITIPSAQFTINLLTELASSQWTWLFAACRKDESLKARFMADPKAVLAEHGLDVPDGMEVKVVENADNCVHITIPSVTFWKTRIGVQLHAIQLVDCLSPF